MHTFLHRIDRQTAGPRYDVTPLFADGDAFAAAIADLSAPCSATECDLVAGIDALGFVLATGVALRLRKGLVTTRKDGKLPVATKQITCSDYGRRPKTLEIRSDIVPASLRVLVVDEWLETGAQITAAIQIIERCGGIVADIATLHMDDHPQSRWLRNRYTCTPAGTIKPSRLTN